MKSSYLFISSLVLVLYSISVCDAKKAGTYGLQIFKNMEQIEYCVPLPLKDFTEVSSDERAKHVFKNKLNKRYDLTVQGMFRQNTQISTEEYFNNSYTNKDDEDGKIVIEKMLNKNSNCFYAIGYWSNMIYESRFLEVTWLRSDEVIKLSVNYPLKDDNIWRQRVKILIQHSTICK